jgi:hypothetical protein
MIIYSNGCSHTRGGEDFFSNSYVDIVVKELSDEPHESIDLSDGLYNKELKKIINTNKKNCLYKHAFYGKSNDLIMLETVNFIYSMNNLNKKIDLLLIQWSGVSRRFHSLPNGVVLNINPHDYPEKGLKFEPIATEQTLQYMKLIQDLCVLYDINYVCIPYMEVDQSVLKHNIFKNDIDFSKYTCPIEIGHRNDFRKNGWAIDIHGHPNGAGIYKLAEMILKIVGKSNLKDINFYFNEKEQNYYINNQEFRLNKKYYKELGEGFIPKNIIKKLF